MDTKKLIAALGLVAVIAVGAHLYLSKAGGTDSDTLSEKSTTNEQQDDGQASDVDDVSEVVENVNAVPPTTSADTTIVTPPASAPNTPASSGSPAVVTEVESEGVSDVLAGFGEEDEDYDDSGLDADFSGNLDDGI